MPLGILRSKRNILLTVVITALLVGSAQAQTETVLYAFPGAESGPDGAEPVAGLVMDTKGNLYGNTYLGGPSGVGTVFEVTTKDVESVLYSFTPTDGIEPQAALVRDKQGNLYGTAYQYGPHGGGAVYEISASGTETILYAFCSQANCTDGAGPIGGLVFDKLGNLYGTTRVGGDLSCDLGNGCGVVFELTPPPGGGAPWNETILHAFTGVPDGNGPYAGLVLNGKNLYGTTYGGGAHNAGTVFKVTTSGVETVLYSFGGTPDGSDPLAPLVSYKGNLYGTTAGGGANGKGTVFKLTPKGAETILYNFTGGFYGYGSYGGVIFDKAGNIYGTEQYYGGFGSVFKLTPPGTWGTYTPLYIFTGSPDGAYPEGGVIFDKKGNLYGTTVQGGNPGCSGGSGCGTVFKVTP